MEKKYSRSTGYGMYPFTVESQRVEIFKTPESKLGYRRQTHINRDTDVTFGYSYRKVRLYNMGDPIENKEYWAMRAAVKNAFCKTFYGRGTEH